MIEGHDIICFSNDWRQDPLSKHHIMRRLSNRNRVLWVNSIGLRTPTFTAADTSRIWSKLQSFFRGIEKISDTLYIISPIVIPFHGISIVRYFNTLILQFQLRYYIRKLAIKNPIIWTFLPNTGSLVGRFNEKLSVYYITDDFTKFTGHPSSAIEKMEKELIDKCDCVIASARMLALKKRSGAKPIHIINHGVNYEHFSRSLSIAEDQLPEEVKNLPHPILGFYGELNDWLDLAMIAEAARKRPDWSFVLIGRLAVELGDIGYLRKIPNVHLLGQKKYLDLPAYCAAFDAALIPMKINDLTLCVNPLKLREYLAAGIPVIAAPLPEIKPYADMVKFAVTAAELIAAYEEICKIDGDKRNRSAMLSKRMVLESWDSKVEEISAVIQGSIDTINCG